MEHEKRLLLRTSGVIHERLIRARGQPPADPLPRNAWWQVERLSRRIRLARARGWQRAGTRLAAQLVIEVEECRRELARLGDQLTAAAARPPMATPADIYRDLESLEREFEAVSCDRASHPAAKTRPAGRLEAKPRDAGRDADRQHWGAPVVRPIPTGRAELTRSAAGRSNSPAG